MRVVIDDKIAFSVDYQPSAADAVLIGQFCEKLAKMSGAGKKLLLGFGTNLKAEVIQK